MSDTIIKSVTISAPIEKVWAALTDYRAFGEWFRVAIDQPFAVGQPSTGKMTYPGFEHYPWKAEIVAIEPMRRFAYRWPHMDDDQNVREDWPWTLVEFILETVDSRTRLTVTESGFSALPAHRRESALRQNTSGWEEQMGNIKSYVDG